MTKLELVKEGEKEGTLDVLKRPQQPRMILIRLKGTNERVFFGVWLLS